MGLLTDPGSGRGKLTQLLVTHYDKLCVALYLGGIAWFVLLAHEHFNAGTYFSENALLPGLVKGDFDEEVLVKQYQSELVEEAARYPDSIPYPWLLAKFHQLSLDTYTHNFTLHYPLGHGENYTGKNVYAIMRAPRSASTEALVLSVPYRPPDSIHPTTVPSIALMMSLAKFFRRQKYWAKDVIFLVTEHEQLGMQAWLEAYHSTTCGRPRVLCHGEVMGRGGAIQAAINLELHSEKIGHVDVKVEGLNGQLPNLDLVNLVHRMCSKEGVRHTFKNRDNLNYRDPMKEWLYQLKTLMAMVTTQATGVPNGNHGLFHRFGIEAVTLEGFEKKGKGSPAVFYQIGRVMEGLFRSLNNLLERFHQSYFFYLQPATDSYISIGMYMPPLGLMCAALLIKAFGLWLLMQEEPIQEDSTVAYLQEDTSFSIMPVASLFLAAHVMGVALLSAPQPFSVAGLDWADLPTDAAIFLGYVLVSFAMIILPVLVAGRVGGSLQSWTLLNIIALLELATLLLAVAMHNFSLALVTAVLYVPVALGAAPASNRFVRIVQKFMWVMLHPLLLMTAIVAGFTMATFAELLLGEQFLRAASAAQQALVFAIVDSYIYGNWVFSVATAILTPNWLLFWLVNSCSAE